MKQAIKYSVYLNADSRLKNKPVFERVVWSDDSVSQNYDELFRSFRHLFGERCVIVVESENVG